MKRIVPDSLSRIKNMNGSMVLILPNDGQGLAQLERQLTFDKFKHLLSGLRKQKTIIRIPKFTVETEYDLQPILKRMGMTEIFDDKVANFTNMVTPKLKPYRTTSYSHQTLHQTHHTSCQFVVGRLRQRKNYVFALSWGQTLFSIFLFISRMFTVLNTYTTNAQKYYGSDTERLNFASRPEQSRTRINYIMSIWRWSFTPTKKLRFCVILGSNFVFHIPLKYIALASTIIVFASRTPTGNIF
jgi:hypothetical protein